MQYISEYGLNLHEKRRVENGGVCRKYKRPLQYADTGHKDLQRSGTKTCEHCGKQFQRHAALAQHRYTFHGVELPLKCKYCDMRFAYPHIRTRHERAHEDPRPTYECEKCSKKFKQPLHFEWHVKDDMCTYKPKRKPRVCEKLPCHYCRKEFTSARFLSNHNAKCPVRLADEKVRKLRARLQQSPRKPRKVNKADFNASRRGYWDQDDMKLTRGFQSDDMHF